MGKISWRIRPTSEKLDSLKIETFDDGHPLGHVSLRTQDADRLIENLATFRAGMKPRVPLEMPNSRSLNGLINPQFAILKQTESPGKLVAFRHDGFGWLSFAFTEAEARKLAQSLFETAAVQRTGKPDVPIANFRSRHAKQGRQMPLTFLKAALFGRGAEKREK